MEGCNGIDIISDFIIENMKDLVDFIFYLFFSKHYINKGNIKY